MATGTNVSSIEVSQFGEQNSGNTSEQHYDSKQCHTVCCVNINTLNI